MNTKKQGLFTEDEYKSLLLAAIEASGSQTNEELCKVVEWAEAAMLQSFALEAVLSGKVGAYYSKAKKDIVFKTLKVANERR